MEHRYEGWNIGSTSIKRVIINDAGDIKTTVIRHGGEVRKTIQHLLEQTDIQPERVIVTGPLVSSFFNLPYKPESTCAEIALNFLNQKPDILLSLGGENFIAYCLKDGAIKNLLSTSKCAAGSGEFLIQQFGRMGYDIEEGLKQAKTGKLVKLASRCSVHCKSDATHKLNKAECSAADIAHSLIVDLANKITHLVKTTNWQTKHIVLMGGLCRNHLLLESLRRLLPKSSIEVLPESEYLEALGAAIAAKQAKQNIPALDAWLRPPRFMQAHHLAPLHKFENKVKRLSVSPRALSSNMRVVLGLDAGSTTTKAALIDAETGEFIVGCYLRTHGNPVRAARECLDILQKEAEDKNVTIIQAASTGSGREMTSIFLNNSLSFNEILAHARAAREYLPDVDTIFEIGGQDAKFIALRDGLPVDYAMNDGCSAGTGSFLEESAASDLHLKTEEIGGVAIQSDAPQSFGERCAAFINSEIRTALQEGVSRVDIVAGLIYSIIENYITRVVGTRQIGRSIVLQGGVALNEAVALAAASCTSSQIVIPPRPELMGAIGSALMARDLLLEEQVDVCDYHFDHFGHEETKEVGHFTCHTCSNHCEILRIAIGDQVYPFGGLCSKFEMQRRPKNLHQEVGEDLVQFRHDLMFNSFAPVLKNQAKGRIGLPLALTTYEFYPFYAKLLTELGYEVVLSSAKPESVTTLSPICYPGELMHAAVNELLQQGVDYIFLPFISGSNIPEGHDHAFYCTTTQNMAGIIKQYFRNDAEKFLVPEINMAQNKQAATRQEILKMADELGIDATAARDAFRTAWDYQKAFEIAYYQQGKALLEKIKGPKIILVGRPYVALAPNINMSLPRKIISRGFSIIPGDLLPFEPPADRRNIWHYSQVIRAAVDYAKQHDDCYICYLSCFSCGPDSMVLHRISKELENYPFCYLEIDSHSAHAGIETRIGAYLEIIEARRLENKLESMKKTSYYRLAKMIIKDDVPMIVTSDNEELVLTDKRVNEVLLYNMPEVIGKMLFHFHRGLGLNVTVPKRASDADRHFARRACSGRECLAFLSTVGLLLQHIENRPKDEVSVFVTLDQVGPCVNGNWFDVLPIIIERLQIKNAVVAAPSPQNNYFGKGLRLPISTVAAEVLGDLFYEIQSSLRCLADNPHEAIKILNQEIDRVALAAEKGFIPAEKALRKARKILAKIPLKKSINDVPKILIIGGITRTQIDVNIKQFFERKGILVKVNDATEFLSFLVYDDLMRMQFDLDDYGSNNKLSWHTLIKNLLNPKMTHKNKRFAALKERFGISVIEMIYKRWHKVLAKSGLFFSKPVALEDILTRAQPYVSSNCLTEASTTLGRYLIAVKEGYDGVVNLRTFNCAPANASEALIRPLANQNQVPYISLEVDGEQLSSGQLLELETLAEQCWKNKKQIEY